MDDGAVILDSYDSSDLMKIEDDVRNYLNRRDYDSAYGAFKRQLKVLDSMRSRGQEYAEAADKKISLVNNELVEIGNRLGDRKLKIDYYLLAGESVKCAEIFESLGKFYQASLSYYERGDKRNHDRCVALELEASGRHSDAAKRLKVAGFEYHQVVKYFGKGVRKHFLDLKNRKTEIKITRTPKMSKPVIFVPAVTVKTHDW